MVEDDLVNAFILGRRPQERDLLLKSATLVATFGLVRVEHPDGDQFGETAARGRGLTAADLRAAVRRLIDRGAAQRRGRAVTIQPDPIAMKLAERQWREWSREEWDAVLAGDGNPDLKVLAAQQLARLDTTEVESEVVKHVCRIGGPFDGFEGISRTDYAEVLTALAEVDREAVAGQIERSLDDVENLSAVEGDARQHLVWALEKIAFHPDSFEDGARLLLRLAVVENEMWGNDATDQFKNLFPVLQGKTAAGGDDRARGESRDTEERRDNCRRGAICRTCRSDSRRRKSDRPW